jgi:hypothetical protein
MAQSRLTYARVGTGFLWTAVALLLGILVLGIGHYSDNRVVFYAGVLITLAGVLNGVRQILPRGES